MMRVTVIVLFCAGLMGVCSCQLQDPGEPDMPLSDSPLAGEVKDDGDRGPGIVVTSNAFFPRIVRGVDGSRVFVEVPNQFPIRICWSPAPGKGRPAETWRAAVDRVDDTSPWEEGTFDGEPACHEFPKNFFFGGHTFTVEAFDAAGHVTRIAVVLDIRVVVLHASIDIMPRRCPNRLGQAEHGRVRVTLFGRSDFDVRNVVPETVRLGTAVAVSMRIKDVGAPAGDADDSRCASRHRDGFEDMLLAFRLADVGDALDTAQHARRVSAEVELFLWGQIGSPLSDDFVGGDAVQIRRKHR